MNDGAPIVSELAQDLLCAVRYYSREEEAGVRCLSLWLVISEDWHRDTVVHAETDKAEKESSRTLCRVPHNITACSSRTMSVALTQIVHQGVPGILCLYQNDWKALCNGAPIWQFG